MQTFILYACIVCTKCMDRSFILTFPFRILSVFFTFICEPVVDIMKFLQSKLLAEHIIHNFAKQTYKTMK